MAQILRTRRISGAYGKPHTPSATAPVLHWRHEHHHAPSVQRTPHRSLGLALLAALLAGVIVALAVSSRSPPHRGRLAGQQALPAADRGSRIRLAPSEADGVIRDGDQPTVFDVATASRSSNLDADLLAAVQRGGHRCRGRRRRAARQQRLAVAGATRTDARQDAVAQYGSEEEAARWVATRGDLGARLGRRGRSRPARRAGLARAAWRASSASARSTATSRGTSSCARTPSPTAARSCTTTPPPTRGRSDDQGARRPRA